VGSTKACRRKVLAPRLPAPAPGPLVGSRTGAVARRNALVCLRGLSPFRARVGRSVAPVPAPLPVAPPPVEQETWAGIKARYWGGGR
jgi:hypothetical protein